MIDDLQYTWRVYRPRPRSLMIAGLMWCLERVVKKADPPHPDALARAARKPHYFIIRTEQDAEGLWPVTISGMVTAHTQGVTLPNAATMAGDALAIELAHLLAENAYPPEPELVFDGLTVNG